MLRRFSRSRAQLARLAPRDQPEPARLAAERQVLGHRHRRDEIDFLIDRADAERPRLAGRADLDRVAVEADLALVAAQGAGHDLDQRRLAGAVLAHQRVDFAGLDPEDRRPRAPARPGNAFETPSISIRAVKASVTRSALADMFDTLAGAQPSHKARARRANARPAP